MPSDLNISGSLNEQQIIMLRLLKTPLEHEDFQQIRRLAVKILSRKLDGLTDRWEEENNITAEIYDEFAKGHFRFQVNF